MRTVERPIHRYDANMYSNFWLTPFNNHHSSITRHSVCDKTNYNLIMNTSKCTYKTFKLSDLVKLNEALYFTEKENTLLPDRDDVGEEQKEAEDLEIPATSEVL